MRTLLPVRNVRVVAIEMVVVFPAPLGPRRRKISPRSSVRSMPFHHAELRFVDLCELFNLDITPIHTQQGGKCVCLLRLSQRPIALKSSEKGPAAGSWAS